MTRRRSSEPDDRPALDLHRHEIDEEEAEAQVERDHIVATLKATNWVLGGWDEAAAELGLSRTTLISKMQRLGIPGMSSARGARRGAGGGLTHSSGRGLTSV